MFEKIVIDNIEVRSGMSRGGRQYFLVIVTTTDGRKMSMYVDKEYDTKTKKMDKINAWTKGTEVLVKVTENGDFLNFDLPSRSDILEERVSQLEKRLSSLEVVIRNAKKAN